MRNAAGRMRGMVDGLLQLSRVNIQGQLFDRVDLSRLASEVLSDLEYQVRQTGGRVEVKQLPQVNGDALQLRQLLQNLIGNALKYHHPDRPPVVKMFARRLPGRIEIVVEDNGIGFNPEEAEIMFQPFHRLVGRTSSEGSGMGLTICQRIAERHGGKITARGEPGQGAVFIVSLPNLDYKPPKVT
jgi:signal transduction histidine kinase